MIFELKQQFQIESARFLPHVPAGHPCGQTHGHSFKIILTLRGPLKEPIGWVRDYHEISTFFEPLLKQLDHKLLNDIPGLENPTSENLAVWIYSRLSKAMPELYCVSIQETSTTECTYPVR